MNRMKLLSLLFFAVLFFAADIFAFDRYVLITKGRIAEDEGRIEEAKSYYREYIESHPANQNIRSGRYLKRKGYYVRNLLSAYSDLLGIYRKTGETAEIDKWVKKIKNTHLKTGFGLKNTYNFAKILKNHNYHEDAVKLFKQIIQNQIKNYNPRNNKVMLRACFKLLKMYQTDGETNKIIDLIESLRQNSPLHDFDLKDKNRLASLYIKYGAKADGEKLLRDITSGDNPVLSDINAFVMAYSNLLKIYHNKKDTDSADNLLRQFSQKISPDYLSSNNMYTLAITYLNCGRKKEGINLLKDVSRLFPHELRGRKALFLLGRLSQSREDWDSAIGYFSEYIEKYPVPPFFALKAFSRLIDCYWTKDADIEFVRNKAAKLADIVNGISDYETQLNLAGDFKTKGMDDLAQAAFSLGLAAAEKNISEHENQYEAMRTYWIIEKYAYVLEKYELVEESAGKISKIANNLKNTGLKPDIKEKTEYIRSQSNLWHSKVLRHKKDYKKSIKLLTEFIENRPADRETGYVMYELGEVYEEAGLPGKAAEMYQMAGDGMWKKKAEKRLNEISAE